MKPKVVRILQHIDKSIIVTCAQGTCKIDVNVHAIQSGQLSAEIVNEIDNDNILQHAYLVHAEIVSANSLCMPVDTRWSICGAHQSYILPHYKHYSVHSSELNCGLMSYNTPSASFCSIQSHNFSSDNLQNVCIRQKSGEIAVPKTYPHSTLLYNVVCAQSCDWTNLHMQESATCAWSSYTPLSGTHYTLYDSIGRIERASTYITSMRQSLVPASHTISCRPFESNAWNLPTDKPSFSATIGYRVYFASFQ